MQKQRRWVIISTVLACSIMWLATQASAKDKAVVYDPADTAINEAIADARETLPHFWDMLAKPRPGDNFSIKVAVTENEHTEHFWAIDIQKSGDAIHATIDNDPDRLTNVKAGQRIRLETNRITDWLYRRDGRIHGAYTLRAKLPRMTKAQANLFRASLAPLPRPGDTQ